MKVFISSGRHKEKCYSGKTDSQFTEFSIHSRFIVRCEL